MKITKGLKIMNSTATTAADTAKKTRPVMQTTLKISSIDRRSSEAAGNYAYMKAEMLKKDGSTREVTAMAFGPAYENLKSQLRKGRKVACTASFDGGILRVVGRPADPAKLAAARTKNADAAAPAVAAQKAPRTPAEPIVTSLQIASVEHRNTEAAGDYAYLKGSIVDAAGETREVTAMAFSQAYELLRDELVEGANVSITAQFGRGAVRIVGGADGQVVNVPAAASADA